MGYWSGQVLRISLLLANLPRGLHSSTHTYCGSGSCSLGNCICESPSAIITRRTKTDMSKTLATTFQCVPAQKLWEMKNPGHCVSKYKYFLGTAIPEVLTDFIILAMPLPYVWNLQMKLRQKLLLSIVFILGGLYDLSTHSAAPETPAHPFLVPP